MIWRIVAIILPKPRLFVMTHLVVLYYCTYLYDILVAACLVREKK